MASTWCTDMAASRSRRAWHKEPVQWALQAQQLGTGHAVAQAMPAIPDDHQVLILFGDVPLVRKETLEALIRESSDRAISVLTVIASDPTGYGRIVRDGAGNVVRIVEQKDANTKERAINEINTGLLAVPARSLRKWLAALKNDNAQGEYYLTDVIVMAVRDGSEGECCHRRCRNRSARRQRQGSAGLSRRRAAQ